MKWPALKITNQARVAISVIAIIAFMLSRLFHVPVVENFVSVIALITLLVSFPAASLGAKVLTLAFLTAGCWMLAQASLPWTTYVFSHGSMLSLLSLFAVLPVLSVPVELGQYSASIATVLRSRVQSIFHLNILITSFAFVCGSFMSLAAIPIMMTSMGPAVQHYPLKNSVQFRSVAAVYGYVLPILWTPVSGVVGIVILSLKLSWVRMLPSLVCLSFAGLVLNWAVFYWLEVRGKTTPAPNQKKSSFIPSPSLRKELSHLSQILIAVGIMVVGVALLDHFLHLGMINVVTWIAIPFAALWSLALKKSQDFVKAATTQLSVQLARMSDQFVVFLAAGFFVTALKLSGLDHELNLHFLQLHAVLGTKLFLFALPFLALAVAMIGVHPVVAIALLGESFNSAVLGIDASMLAITLIGSALLTYMLGPFGGTLGLVQSLTRISSFRLALWNAPYAVAFWALLSAVILIFG